MRNKTTQLSKTKRKKTSSRTHSSKIASRAFKQVANQQIIIAAPTKFAWHHRLGKSFCLHWPLFFVVVAAALMRLTFLHHLPWGLNRDEAALAYNAYLLEQTGTDEWQRSYPVTLESFGDYKLPGYTYVLLALFKFLPADDLVVRLPSAIGDIALVIISYSLIMLLVKKKSFALLAASMVAFNPVFIWYSRGAWEANLGLAYFAMAILIVFFRAQKNSWRPLSLLSVFVLLLLSFFTYNTPLLIAVMLWFLLPWLFNQKPAKTFTFPLMLVSAIAIVVSALLLFPANSQKNGITLFSDATTHYQYTLYRQNLSSTALPFFGNKVVYLAGLIAKNVLATFSLSFWRHSGSHEWHQLPDSSIFNAPTIICIYLMLFFIFTAWLLELFTERKIIAFARSYELKILVLVLLTSLPAAITADAPHVTRSLVLFWLLVLLAACVGNFFVLRVQAYQPLDNSPLVRLRQWWIQSPFIIFLVLVIAFSGAAYWSDYRTILTKRNLYHGGLATVLSSDDPPTLIVNSLYSNRAYQYIQLAWETKMPPEKFYRTLVRESASPNGIKAVSDLAQYHFLDPEVDWWPNWQVIDFNLVTQRWEKKINP